jgi:hypothetical protein
MLWILVPFNVLYSKFVAYVPFIWNLHCLLRENSEKQITYYYREVCFLVALNI